MAHPPTVLAQAAASTVHDLAHQARPAITTLTVGDLYAIATALVELTAALPQILTQLSHYPVTDDPDHQARTALHRAAAAAGPLAAAVQAAHQALGDLAENNHTNTRGSVFNRR